MRVLSPLFVIVALGSAGACKLGELEPPDSSASGVLYGIDGFNKVAGNLYQVDPATANVTVVGPAGVAIRALATRPSDGAVFGVGGETMDYPRNFASIDVATGAATVISSAVVSKSLVFTQASELRHLLPCGPLASLDPTTGASTALGGESLPCGDRANTIVRLADGTGWLITGQASNPIIDLDTGLVLGQGPAAADVVGVTRHNGVLYGVRGGNNTMTSTLVVIDEQTGEVTEIGALPTNLHALTSSAPDAPPEAAP
jgi:hypothetical protein